MTDKYHRRLLVDTKTRGVVVVGSSSSGCQKTDKYHRRLFVNTKMRTALLTDNYHRPLLVDTKNEEDGTFD